LRRVGISLAYFDGIGVDRHRKQSKINNIESQLMTFYGEVRQVMAAEHMNVGPGGPRNGESGALLHPLPRAAERLGVKVSCLRSWIYERKIEYVKVGRSVRISEAVIEEIIRRGTMPARQHQ
jgi:excisionase family DNA binding protein